MTMSQYDITTYVLNTKTNHSHPIMTTIDLDEVEPIITQHLEQFDNNKGLFVRHCIKYYHHQKQQQEHQFNINQALQLSIYLFLGMGLLSFTLEVYFPILLLVFPFLFVIAGMEMLIFSLLLVKNRNGIGEKKWISKSQ